MSAHEGQRQDGSKMRRQVSPMNIFALAIGIMAFVATAACNRSKPSASSAGDGQPRAQPADPAARTPPAAQSRSAPGVEADATKSDQPTIGDLVGLLEGIVKEVEPGKGSRPADPGPADPDPGVAADGATLPYPERFLPGADCPDVGPTDAEIKEEASAVIPLKAGLTLGSTWIGGG